MIPFRYAAPILRRGVRRVVFNASLLFRCCGLKTPQWGCCLLLQPHREDKWFPGPKNGSQKGSPGLKMGLRVSKGSPGLKKRTGLRSPSAGYKLQRNSGLAEMASCDIIIRRTNIINFNYCTDVDYYLITFLLPYFHLFLVLLYYCYESQFRSHFIQYSVISHTSSITSFKA